MASERAFLRPERVLAAALLAAGCAALRPSPAPLHPEGPRGSWYTVQAGDTLAQIAARTGVPAEDLLEINGLASGAALEPGRIIFVLEREGGAGAGAATAGAPAVAWSVSAATPLRWPLAEPRLSSPFGARDGRTHEGIDLAAPIGTSIRAADAGEVMYAGDAVRGYGNMVVLRHAGDLVTVYAHNSVVLVHAGDQIAAGQEIALVGQSGRATAPHLHFEVRRAQVPQDPLRFLPQLPQRK